MINFSFGHFFLCWKARSAQVSGPIVHSRLLNVEPRALYRCQEKGKRCSQQNKVFKKELARCCRDRRKTARRRFCYARGAQEEGERNKPTFPGFPGCWAGFRPHRSASQRNSIATASVRSPVVGSPASKR